MAHLVHNDYLEQASDSGYPGMIFYSGFWLGALALNVRRPISGVADIRFCVWLGLLGWAVQGFSEFGLYIPALAWPSFALAGWISAGKGHRQQFGPPIESSAPG